MTPAGSATEGPSRGPLPRSGGAGGSPAGDAPPSTAIREIAVAPRGVSSEGHVPGTYRLRGGTEAGPDAEADGARPAPSADALVIGLGSPDRGDDAVGPIVARRVADLRLAGVRVLAHEDPTDLVTSMTGAGGVVVVDAVWSPGSAPGELIILETGAGAAPLPEDAWARTGRGGTHAFGLAAAVELARALRRLPPRVVLVGIAAGGFEHGEPLSPGVAAAVDRAVEAVREVLGR